VRNHCNGAYGAVFKYGAAPHKKNRICLKIGHLCVVLFLPTHRCPIYHTCTLVNKRNALPQLCQNPGVFGAAYSGTMTHVGHLVEAWARYISYNPPRATHRCPIYPQKR
jgi:hypothetical protein